MTPCSPIKADSNPSDSQVRKYSVTLMVCSVMTLATPIFMAFLQSLPKVSFRVLLITRFGAESNERMDYTAATALRVKLAFSGRLGLRLNLTRLR